MGQGARGAISVPRAVQGESMPFAAGAVGAVAGTEGGPGRVAVALGRRGGDVG
jgi:hypothetical protein